MNFFTFRLGKNTPFTPVADKVFREQQVQVQPISSEKITGKSVAEIKPVSSIALQYAGITGNSRENFNPPEYSLEEIGRIEDVDSYVQQAYMKKIGLLLKEGYELVGANPQTIQYVKQRLDQIAFATSISTPILIRDIGSALIKKSNAFLVKVRNEKASGGARRKTSSGKTVLPVAGYFIAPAETMMADVNEFGKVRKWRQRLPNGHYKDFLPDDVIHFHFNRKEGMLFGTPTIIPVKDDIRALRKIEENIEMLVYQHLFPLFHYTIGTDNLPAHINEQGESEITQAWYNLQRMPAEGGLVTDHRHEITSIGGEKALRAEPYLDHFKKRVFSGLGVSAVDMGEGECHDELTETLTENGWKFHFGIDHTKEKIGTYNPATHRIEFNIANSKHLSDYAGKMIKFCNKRLDLLVTPKHDMWVKPDPTSLPHNIENPSEYTRWQKVKARDLFAGAMGKKFTFLQAAPFDYDGEIEDNFQGLAVLAAAVATTGIKVNDSIKIRVFSRHSESVINALIALRIPYQVQEGKSKDYDVSRPLSITLNGKHEFLYKFIENFNITKLLEPYSLLFKKVFLTRYASSSPYSSHASTYAKNQGDYALASLTHKNQNFINDLQIAFLSAGYTSTAMQTKSGWKLTVSLTEYEYSTVPVHIKDLSEVDHSGKIYCYNVPNHLFVTRRAGFISIQGNTANRSTSETMSLNLVDSVKDIQRAVEAQFEENIINELLLESTFGITVLDETNRVHLRFKEIDIGHQIKRENHYADLFHKNTITLHEARTGIGRQPYLIPTIEDTQSNEALDAKYPEWHATAFKLMDEPKLLLNRAVDAELGMLATGAANNRSLSVNNEDLAAAQKAAAEKQKLAQKAKENTQPTIKDGFFTHKSELLESDILDIVRLSSDPKGLISQYIYMTVDSIISEFKTQLLSSFIDGYSSIALNGSNRIADTIQMRSYFDSSAYYYTNRVFNYIKDNLTSQDFAKKDKSDKLLHIKTLFETNKDRFNLIENSEIIRAKNIGILKAGASIGFNSWTLDIQDGACSACQLFKDKVFNIAETLESFENVPPFHPHARSNNIKIMRTE